MLLIVILMYVFGIFFTESVNDATIERAVRNEALLGKYWGTLGSSMTTLFKSVSGGLSWQEAVDPLDGVAWHLSAVFSLYISFAYFAVLNVVTGVFCQSAIEGAQRDQDTVMTSIMANKKYHIEKVKALFQKIDNDGSGGITLQELERHIEDEEVR